MIVKAEGMRDYFNTFRNIAFRCEDGILEMRLHSGGGPLRWGADAGSIHEQLGHAFRAVGDDRNVKILIFTGTGDNFCRKPNGDELTESSNYASWMRLSREARAMFMNLLDIDVPVISAINGPATIHSELPVLADIVLAADTTIFRDTHMKMGVVPGDGCHAIWNMLLGRSRGHYYLLTSETITAQTALQFGVVHEIHPLDQLSERAWVLARQLASQPMDTLRYSRMLFAQPIKESLLRELGYGMALEGLTAIRQAERSSL